MIKIYTFIILLFDSSENIYTWVSPSLNLSKNMCGVHIGAHADMDVWKHSSDYNSQCCGTAAATLWQHHKSLWNFKLHHIE